MASTTMRPDPAACGDEDQLMRIGACRALLHERMAEIDADAAEIFADWQAEIGRPEFLAGAENLAFYLAAR
ncbi:MAG: hypothetical protein KAH44_04220, partial [Oricola sp.]|nr:hypothetical protein [Oricola sp.]